MLADALRAECLGRNTRLFALSGASGRRSTRTMEHSVTFSMAEVVRFGIVMFRVMGLMIFVPLFNSRSIPPQVRVTAGLLITLALLPSMPLSAVPANFGLVQIVGTALSETVIGMVLGLTASFIFSGMQMAGHIIGFQLGFSLINVIDPQSEVETTAIEFMENYVGMLFYLLLNCHHWFLLAVSSSFGYLPVQGARVNGPLVQEIIRLSSQIFTSGLQIAAPVLAVSVIADAVLGILGRAAPQIHLLVVGMPVKTLVGIIFLSISFYFLPQLLGDYYGRLYQNLFALVHAMA